MDSVKGEPKTKAAAAAVADGARRRRPLVPSELKNNAAAPAGRRREVPSRFKPVAATPELAAAASRRCISPSPGRASTVDGSATCNRARSADRARPAAASAAPSSRLKPSTLAVPRSRSPARDRDAVTEAHSIGTPPRARNAKVSNGLWVSSRSSSPLVRPEPVQLPAAAEPVKKIDRLVHGLPSEPTKLRSGAASGRKRSPLRGSTTNNIGDQCENARPSDSPANRVSERHRWPGMITSTRAAPAAEKTSRSVSSSDASAGRSPRRMHMLHPSEGTGSGSRSLKQPSNEMAKVVHRRRKEDSSSDTSFEFDTSESSKPTCCPSKAISSPVRVVHRSSSPRQGSSAAASTPRSCQSPSRLSPSGPCRSKCAPSTAQSSAEQPVFSYIVDAGKGKKIAGQIENIHQLRLLNNRYLQWHFVNAHSEDTLSHKNGDEFIDHTIVIQIGYLEQWSVLEEENTDTVVEAIEALQASTLCLPVTSGAQA
ncbi:hypothetical protein HU200_003064 [Digitaria exilis]|uniref:Uncharacterized protein n=1 Tax=Digitaria exilis TaxID=1010633 RepID=A0A835KV08_9POAL|nr:hypothetical protein HU200_003064 [Digitaria exilis]